MLTIDKTKVDEIINGLLGNNNLTASPEVWYGLHQIRKLPATEIVRCGECKHASTDATCCLVCNREGMGLRPYHVHSDDYCSYAERRTDEVD